MILLALALAASAPVTKRRAVALLTDAMQRIDPTTPDFCLSFDTKAPTRNRFDVTVREVHDYRCGGDPAQEVVREHFRVTRKPLAISRLDAADNRYKPCIVAKNAVTCPATAK